MDYFIPQTKHLSHGPGQTTPPNHISSGFVYLVLYALLLPDLQTEVE
jgi:membrane-associated PAP2 superfamily phosphatase